MLLVSKPRITVILVVYNEEKHIELAMNSVLKQNFDIKQIEFIIVDGGSTDRTREIVEYYILQHSTSFSDFKLIDNPKKILATGWNIAIKASNAPFVLRFDGHSQLDENYITSGLDAMESLSESCAAVGGWMLHKGSSLLSSCASIFYTSPLGGGSASFRREPKNVIESDTALFAIYRKKIMLEAGLFNENQKRNQDIELHKRISNKGFKFFTIPNMKVTYYVRSNLKSLLLKAFNDGFWVGCSEGKFLRHLVPFFFLIYLFLGMGASLVNPMIVGNIFLISLLTYFLIIYVDVCKRERQLFRAIISLPIFFSYHVFYGLGTLKGIIMSRRKGL